MKVYFSKENPNKISMQAAGSVYTIYTSERPLPFNRWLYVKAITNTDSFGLTVLSLDEELIASNYYEGIKAGPGYTSH